MLFWMILKNLSSKSFDIYWKKQEKINFKNESSAIKNDSGDKNIPKFISDYSKNNNKK